jgi:hypothetical protein
VDPIRFEAEPYRREAHEAFVKSSWCKGAREPWETLAARLRRPDTRCLVAHLPGDPDSLLGWAAAADGAIVWAYSRELYGKVRRRGLMTSLLLELGVDVSEPTPCLYWSPAAAAIAARGYRIFYAPSLSRARARTGNTPSPKERDMAAHGPIAGARRGQQDNAEEAA